MQNQKTSPIISLAAMVLVLAFAYGLDQWSLFWRREIGRTAQYVHLSLWNISMGHLLMAILLLSFFYWMVLRVFQAKWIAWIFLLVGLFISFYPVLYWTQIGQFLSRLGLDWTYSRFLFSAAAFIAVTGAFSLFRNRQNSVE
jgi:hypothetical protein